MLWSPSSLSPSPSCLPVMWLSASSVIIWQKKAGKAIEPGELWKSCSREAERRQTHQLFQGWQQRQRQRESRRAGGCSQEETARERQRGAGEQSQQVQQKSMSVRLPPACKGTTEERRHCRDRGEGGGRWAREPERGERGGR